MPKDTGSPAAFDHRMSWRCRGLIPVSSVADIAKSSAITTAQDIGHVFRCGIVVETAVAAAVKTWRLPITRYQAAHDDRDAQRHRRAEAALLLRDSSAATKIRAFFHRRRRQRSRRRCRTGKTWPISCAGDSEDFRYIGDEDTITTSTDANLLSVCFERPQGPAGGPWHPYLFAARAQGWSAAGLNFPRAFPDPPGKPRMARGRSSIRSKAGRSMEIRDLRELLKVVHGAAKNWTPATINPSANREILIRLQNM